MPVATVTGCLQERVLVKSVVAHGYTPAQQTTGVCAEVNTAMRIGGSLFLIAIGAILKWAISAHVSGVNLSVIGIILMVVGALALLITVIFMSMRRRTDVYQENNGPYVNGGAPAQGYSRTTYKEPNRYDTY